MYIYSGILLSNEKGQDFAVPGSGVDLEGTVLSDVSQTEEASLSTGVSALSWGAS